MNISKSREKGKSEAVSRLETKLGHTLDAYVFQNGHPSWPLTKAVLKDRGAIPDLLLVGLWDGKTLQEMKNVGGHSGRVRGRESKAGAGMEVKSFIGEIRGHDDNALIVSHCIASEARDRQGDVLRILGCQIPGKPVVLFGHGQSHYGAEPIAKPLDIWKGEFRGYPALFGKIQFWPDENGKRWYRKVKEGYFPNVSVGFIPLEYTDFQDQRGGRDIKTWELLEWSLVGVPTQALATTVDKSLKSSSSWNEEEALKRLSAELSGHARDLVEKLIENTRQMTREELARMIAEGQKGSTARADDVRLVELWPGEWDGA